MCICMHVYRVCIQGSLYGETRGGLSNRFLTKPEGVNYILGVDETRRGLVVYPGAANIQPLNPSLS